jgi:hypothetical protein
MLYLLVFYSVLGTILKVSSLDLAPSSSQLLDCVEKYLALESKLITDGRYA